jgi:hypothetical protein
MKSLLLLSIIAIIFLYGCAHKKQHPYESLISRAKPQWFNHQKEYSLTDHQGFVRPHLFYDIEPELNQKQSHINFVPLSIEGSKANFDIDMPSGQRFFTYNSCMAKDLWRTSKRSFSTLPYTIGFVPRILDQLGLPQKVIVFGGKDIMDVKDDVFYRVKILGGVVEQLCLAGKCTGTKSWLSRLDLIAVYEGDPDFENIRNLDDLFKMKSWDDVKVALENMGGGNDIGGKVVPSVKMGRPLPRQDVIDYLMARNINFTNKELMGLRHSCGKLYDLFWKDVGTYKIFDRPHYTAEDVKEELRQKAELKAKNLPAEFNRRLHRFFNKYVDEFYTCSKFHYLGNVNENPDRFWFLSFMNVYVRLHKKGYFYDCRSKSWQMNVSRERKDDVSNLKEDINHCSNKEIDLAFEYLELSLKAMRNYAPESFRFIDYDNHELGTHQKMYSWVEEKKRGMSCSSERDVALRNQLPIVPTEVKWLKRSHLDKKSELGIID